MSANTYDLLDIRNYGVGNKFYREQIEYATLGYIRRELPLIRIDDIATLVFSFVLDQHFSFFHNKTLSTIKYIPYQNKSTKTSINLNDDTKSDEKENKNNNDNISDEFNPLDNHSFHLQFGATKKDSDYYYDTIHSAVLFTPFISQLFMQHTNQLKQLRLMTSNTDNDSSSNNEKYKKRSFRLEIRCDLDVSGNSNRGGYNPYGRHNLQCGILIIPKKHLIKNIDKKHHLKPEDLFVDRSNIAKFTYYIGNEKVQLSEIEWKLNQRFNVDVPARNGCKTRFLSYDLNHGTCLLNNKVKLKDGYQTENDGAQLIFQLCIDYWYNDKYLTYKEYKKHNRSVNEISTMLDASKLKAVMYFSKNGQMIGKDINRKKDYGFENGKVELNFVDNYHLIVVSNKCAEYDSDQPLTVQVTKFYHL